MKIKAWQRKSTAVVTTLVNYRITTVTTLVPILHICTPHKITEDCKMHEQQSLLKTYVVRPPQ